MYNYFHSKLMDLSQNKNLIIKIIRILIKRKKILNFISMMQLLTNLCLGKNEKAIKLFKE